MPVLINQATQLAEEIPEKEAQSGIDSGQYVIPLVDPHGNYSTAPFQDAQHLVKNQGYTQPNDTQLQSLLNYAKYSSTPEQLKTAAEGAASGATFGFSTGLEQQLLGVTPEEQQLRREINPGVYGLGEAAGLLGSSAVGLGEGAAAAKAAQLVGKGVTRALGETGVISKVGSLLAKNAVETALISSGDEVSKAFAKDPNQTIETAAANIGLGGLIGAGFGAGIGTVSPLWKAASESKIGQFLNVISKKANGLDKEALPGAEISELAQNAGVDLDPIIKAGLSENPEARSLFSELQESVEKPGLEAKQTLQKFKKILGDSVLSSVDKTPSQIDSLSNLSENQVGSKIKDSLIEEIESRTKPLSEKFNQISQKFSKEPINESEKIDLMNQLGEVNQKYAISPSSDEFRKINTIISELKNVKTLEDLRNFQSVHLGDISNKELFSISKPVKKAFRDAEENLVSKKLGESEVPEVLMDHMTARKLYSDEMNTIDSLNERLRVGNDSSPGQFIRNLKEMTPEKVLSRISQMNDANFLKLLEEKFPRTVQQVKDSFLNQALEKASSKANFGETINARTLSNIIQNWSPELRDFVLTKDAQSRISSVSSLLDKIPERINPSGTGQIVNHAWSKVTGGAIGLTSLMMGHGPIPSFIVGYLSKHLGTSIPDAVKLATLKFLGSDVPVKSTAFKALADLLSHTIQGENLKKKAIQSIFKSGALVFPQTYSIKDSDRKRIQKKLDEFKLSPEKMIEDQSGEIHHYFPEGEVSMGALKSRAISYLNSIVPNETPAGILDSQPVISDEKKAQYDRAMDIVNQPLLVLNGIKEGKVTSNDLNTLQTVYPALYSNLIQRITHEVIQQKSEGKEIPYTTRIGLSLFMKQPLDSTMTPQSIQSTQIQAVNSSESSPIPSQKKGSMKALSDYSQNYLTPLQARNKSKLS